VTHKMDWFVKKFGVTFLYFLGISDYISGDPIVNVGGGLGIKYDKSAEDLPSPAEYIECFTNFDQIENIQIIFEPGRSLVGN